MEEEGKFLGDPIWAEIFGTGFDARSLALNDLRWSMTSIPVERSRKYSLPRELRRDEKRKLTSLEDGSLDQRRRSDRIGATPFVRRLGEHGREAEENEDRGKEHWNLSLLGIRGRLALFVDVVRAVEAGILVRGFSSEKRRRKKEQVPKRIEECKLNLGRVH